MPLAELVMKTAVPGTRVALGAADLMKISIGRLGFVHACDHQLTPLRPGGQEREGDRADQKREPASRGDLGQVRAEIAHVHGEEEDDQLRRPGTDSTSTW